MYRGTNRDPKRCIDLHFSGEEGGAYQVPLDTLETPQPQRTLLGEAPGYQSRSLNLDGLLFDPELHTGKTTRIFSIQNWLCQAGTGGTFALACPPPELPVDPGRTLDQASAPAFDLDVKNLYTTQR